MSTEDTLLLAQQALVLLGSASHVMLQQRRKIAWTRINSKLKSLAMEEYDKCEMNLFGPAFLEKASKRIEVDKTMEKVFSPSQKGSRFLQFFYPKATPARYGGRSISASSCTVLKTGQEVLPEASQSSSGSNQNGEVQAVPVNPRGGRT